MPRGNKTLSFGSISAENPKISIHFYGSNNVVRIQYTHPLKTLSGPIPRKLWLSQNYKLAWINSVFSAGEAFSWSKMSVYQFSREKTFFSKKLFRKKHCFLIWKMNANFSEFLNCCCRFPASGPPLFLWSLIVRIFGKSCEVVRSCATRNTGHDFAKIRTISQKIANFGC